jgi:hypothetical protein
VMNLGNNNLTYYFIIDNDIAFEMGNSRNFVHQGLREKRVRHWELGRKGCDSVSAYRRYFLILFLTFVVTSRKKTLRKPEKKTLQMLCIFMIDFCPVRHNFSFRCHRRDLVPNSKDQSLIYAINDISYHPVHGTVSTCGPFPRLFHSSQRSA